MTSASLLLVGLALVFLLVSASWARLPLWPAVLCLILERAIALWGK